MKLDKRPEIARFAANPPADVRLFLFYGADEASARASAASLFSALAGSEDTEKVHLSPANLKDSPSKLADEGAAISMFGGKRVCWVEPIAGAGANQVIAAAEALLEAGRVDNPAILIAGDLKPTHALVKLVQASKAGAALRFYAPSARDAEAAVKAMCAEMGLEPTRSALLRLTETALASQAVAEQELRKYALYLGATPETPQPLEDETLDLLGAAFAEAAFGTLVDGVLGGRPKTAIREQGRLTAEGKVAVAQTRALLRRLHQILDLNGAKPPGQSASAYLDSLGRRIFWKDKPALAAQMDLWPLADAERALDRLSFLEAKLKSSGSVNGDVRAAQEFLALARRGQQRRQRNLR
ncbi:hypothetical protein B5C34_04210 [Pacificimonas flava]|uniref:DNA-directed DNA polymerase n=2 Tax=Pacificimonas TaxID=1960290 RepID=A0A219B344_9SPHN|nr:MULTISPECIES: hypothetical protein [Pacificimonas]MBZ6377577.1 hypothetical protein [Pacificimonas aurantium]OWV32731.1 hypothetical protein B5C34_04210 [Pacificimonas flava]